MKGDFSRVSFDPNKHFTRVLQQQGRVQLDADWNEQAAIVLHYQQMLAADLIGPHGGPADEVNSDGMVRKRNLGFAIITDAGGNLTEATDAEREYLNNQLASPDDNGPLLIGKGRYYVNGLQAAADDYYSLYHQPDYPWPPGEKLRVGRYVMYLDVWERHITCIEDKSIREVALEGADTTTRAKLVWQVKAKPLSGEQDINDQLEALKTELYPANRGWLKVRAKYEGKSEPCIIAPEASYRGLENQLYRVELYWVGTKPWFKWSRDNASTATAAKLLGNLVKVEEPRGFVVGQWVELTSNEQELRGRASPLYQIKKIEGDELFLNTTAVDTPSDLSPGETWPTKARHWGGAQAIKESSSEWQTLADGVQVQFQPLQDATSNQYRTGDYWLIPLRTATGNVDWPPDTALPPQGITHAYAPLAIVDISTTLEATFVRELRKAFKPLALDL